MLFLFTLVFAALAFVTQYHWELAKPQEIQRGTTNRIEFQPIHRYTANTLAYVFGFWFLFEWTQTHPILGWGSWIVIAIILWWRFKKKPPPIRTALFLCTVVFTTMEVVF